MAGFLKKIWVMIWLIFLSQPFATAHEPHDDIYEVEISPEYSKDQTLYIIVRRNLFKSTDGGQTWVRLSKGLDHKGYLESLALFPGNKDVLYVSALGGGLFRSGDEGLTWERVSKGIDVIEIDEILVSPHSEDIVLCAARSGGVYMTTTGGRDWVQILPENIRATSFSFFPQDKNRILVGSNDGVLYQSLDNGKSWEELFSSSHRGAITAIAVSPNFVKNKKFFFGIEGGGFHFTRNGGKNFIKKERDSMSVKHIQDIQFLPSSEGRDELILSTWHEGVFQSPNDGWYWFERSKGLTRDPQADHPDHLDMLGEQAGGEHRRPHFDDLRVSDGFLNDKTIFVGGFKGLFKSTDGGWNWREVDTYSRSVIGVSVSPDYKNDLTIAVATYADGAYISENAGKSWSSLPRKLKYVRNKTSYYLKGESREHYLELLWPRFYDIKFSPDYAKDKTLYITPLHLETKLFKCAGRDCAEVSLPKPDSGGTLAFSPDFKNDGVMYLASQKGAIYRSNDRGASFEYVARMPIEWGHNSVSLPLSPYFTQDKTMFFSATMVKGGAYKSIDSGRTWKSITKDTPLEELKYIQLALSPGYNMDRTVVAGTDNGAYITKNSGSSWTKLVLSKGLKRVFVEAVAVSPDYFRDGIFLVYVRGTGLFKTSDRGKTFHQIDDNTLFFTRANIPAGSNPIQFSPKYFEDKTIYGYGAAGANIFKSTDGGKNWHLISIPKRKETFFDRIMDTVLWVKSWIPVLIWRTKVFFSKTQPLEEAGLAAAALLIIFILLMAFRGMTKK